MHTSAAGEKGREGVERAGRSRAPVLAVVLAVSCAALGLKAAGAFKGPVAEQPSMEEYVADLKHKDYRYRRSAVTALGQMGAKASGAVPAMIELFGDGDEKVRTAAWYAVLQVGPAAFPSLMRAANHQDATVRFGVASALGMLGEEASEAVPALVRALDDKDEMVRWAAAHALGEMGVKAKEAEGPLERMAQGDDVVLSREAAESMAKIEPRAAVDLEP